jgi:hypothetical protein
MRNGVRRRESTLLKSSRQLAPQSGESTMKLRVLALSILALCTLSVGAQAQTSFTTPTYTPGCSSRLTPDAQNLAWTCWPMTTLFSNGDRSYTGFYIVLAQDGTFTGTFYDDEGGSFQFPFAGTWSGTELHPTAILGTFTGGSASYQLGLVTRGGYKGSKIRVWSVPSGAGSIQ